MRRYTDVLAPVGGVDAAALDAIEAPLGCFDPINIQFTSGTTGHPKGATLTHHNIVNNGYRGRRGDRASAGPTGCASRCRCTTASAW